jgi:hypothetical protein
VSDQSATVSRIRKDLGGKGTAVMVRFLTLLTLSVLILRFLPGCSGTADTVAGGSGSTTTNGFTVAVVSPEGEPVSSAVVRIRPDDYIVGSFVETDSSDGISVFDTITGNDGLVSCMRIRPGDYSIEIINEENNAGVLIRDVIAPDSLHDFGVATVQPLGKVTGEVSAALLDQTENLVVEVYGLERSVPVDPETGIFVIDDLPPSGYRLRLSSDDSIVDPVEEFAAVTVNSDDTVYVNRFAQWIHSARISINPTAAGLDNGDTLYQFPLVVRLSADEFDFSTAKKKGEDLRIAKVNGDPVSFETEWWDSANGTASLWVLCDTLIGNSAESYVMQWGNRNASAVSQPSAVFDTTSGYYGVWHFNESGGKPQRDATVNGNDGIPAGMDGANDVSGLIGRAQQFEGDSQWIAIENSDVSSGQFTVSVWVHADAVPSDIAGILASTGRYGEIHLNSEDQWVYSSSGDGDDRLTTQASVGQWCNLSVVGTENRRYLYVNGTVVDSMDSDALPPDTREEYPIYIGSQNESSGWLQGTVDEVRIHHRAVSELWIRACYETQRESASVASIEPLE